MNQIYMGGLNNFDRNRKCLTTVDIEEFYSIAVQWVFKQPAMTSLPIECSDSYKAIINWGLSSLGGAYTFTQNTEDLFWEEK